MAFRRDRHPDMNLNEIDYSITYNICQNFDIDRSWEQLAGVIGYPTKHIQTFELETRRPDGSPTKKLLWDWGTRGATVRDLYDKLNLINKAQSVRLLEPIMKLEKQKDFEKDALSGVKGDNSNNSCSSSSMMTNDDNMSVASSNGMGSSGPGNLPIPKKNKNLKGPAQSGDVNFNTWDSKPAKPWEKDKQKMLDIPGVGTSSAKVQEYHVDGPASGPGNMGAAAASARSFERVKSAVEEYDSTNPPYMSQLSDSEQNMARALRTIPNYTYKELSQSTGGFSERFEIGDGKFGKVYKGKVKNTEYAIKKLYQRPDMNLENDTTNHLAAELQSLSRYRHDNIVSLYAYALDGDEICLLYQYMHNGSLEDCLHKNGGKHVLSWEQRLVILRGAACGLQFLHSVDPKPVIHGDIKSSNILLDKHFEAKIGDLGMAQQATRGEVTGKYTHITKKTTGIQDFKTRAYLPPEMTRGGSSSLKGDTFAFGVVMFECLTGQQAYDNRREGSVEEKNLVIYIENYVEDHPKCNKQKRFQDQRLEDDFPTNVFMSLFEAAEQCTKEKKKDRPSMVEVYKIIESVEGSLPDVDYCNIKGPKMTTGITKLDSQLKKQTSNDENNSHGTEQSPVKMDQPMSPVDYLPHDRLPESVKLQMEVDKRKKTANESNYVNVDNLRDVQDIFKSDPKKLAEIEQSDRAFKQGSMNNIDANKQEVQDKKQTFDLIDTHKEVYYVNATEVEVIEVRSEKTIFSHKDLPEVEFQKPEKMEKVEKRKNVSGEESAEYVNIPVEITDTNKEQVFDMAVVQQSQAMFHDYDAELDEIREKAVKPNSSMMDIFKRFDDAKEEELDDDTDFSEQYEDGYNIHFDFEGSESSDCSTLKLCQPHYERIDSFHLSGVTDEDLFGGDANDIGQDNIPETSIGQVENKLQEIQLGGRDAGENEEACSLDIDNDVSDNRDSIDTSLQKHRQKQAQYCTVLNDMDKKRAGDIMVDNLIAGKADAKDCLKINKCDRQAVEIDSVVKGPPSMYKGLKATATDNGKGTRVASESEYVYV